MRIIGETEWMITEVGSEGFRARQPGEGWDLGWSWCEIAEGDRPHAVDGARFRELDYRDDAGAWCVRLEFIGGESMSLREEREYQSDEDGR